MPWDRIPALVTNDLSLREDSVARLAAQHISIKSDWPFSVYRSYVPFSIGYLAEYIDPAW
jgi:hypothetical protein